MLLKDYIKQCLKNPEFRKYWEEDFPDYEFDDRTADSLSMDEAIALLNSINNDDLYEDKEQYKSDLNNLITNKGIKGNNSNSATIELYQHDGKCPVVDFLDDISDEKLKEKTVKNIYNLSILGSNARPPLSKYIDDGIYELRTQQSSNYDRIFYFFVVGNKIVLTNGYVKKQDKLDKTEFNKAKAYMKEYLNR